MVVAAVKEFLALGCHVTGFDRKPIEVSQSCSTSEQESRFNVVIEDLTQEHSVADSFKSATGKFGPVNILVANAGTDESAHPPIWEVDRALWDKVNTNKSQRPKKTGAAQLENVAIAVTGSETGKFGKQGHSEYAASKAGLQYRIVRRVKNEIVQLTSKARTNAVAPGWVNTPLIGDRLDDPKKMWSECQATVALKKISKPEDAAGAMAFLANHRAAGSISGECISVDGGMEGRIIWREEQNTRCTIQVQEWPD
ncbi:hypothetical protein LTR84_010211 [Exophiala bonariae]|uniref:3-oxoacyl-[acyl-carrier protein] reductase n=1 Tax=Exophiala bonariae TaxID=1690606 RepID=A0AAV9MWY1_9EURO|nr:hypothetical protein LTR84_010211 [Exophiala bonariae]